MLVSLVSGAEGAPGSGLGAGLAAEGSDLSALWTSYQPIHSPGMAGKTGQEQATMEEIEKTASADYTAGKTDKPRNVFRTVGIVLVAVLILTGVGFGIYGLVTHPQVTAVIRDLFIIVLALVTVIIGLFLVILVFQLQSLIALLRDEIKPILESANRTASTVRGTTSFVSDAVVSPVIRAASLAAGVGQTVRTLTRTGRKDARVKQTGTDSRQEP